MENELDAVIQRWKNLTKEIKKQALNKEHTEIVRRRFKKEKLGFLAETKNISDVSFGLVFEELEKELELALEMAELNFQKKSDNKFMSKVIDKLSHALEKIIYGKL